VTNGSNQKDFWDRLQIVLSPVGGLLTAIAVAMLGIMGSRTVERQQSSEAKLRLYSELMTRREESEATLRKEMFQSIIGSFFDPASSSLETRLLKMELLAQNFHEALNLVPLFEHIQREIDDSRISRDEKRLYSSRLHELAREVTRKQMIVLEASGRRHDWTVMISDTLANGSGSEQLDDVDATLDGSGAASVSRSSAPIPPIACCESASRSKRRRSLASHRTPSVVMRWTSTWGSSARR
jgi:hypothetical protein